MERQRVTDVRKNIKNMADNQLSQTMEMPVIPNTTGRDYQQAMQNQYGDDWVFYRTHGNLAQIFGMPTYDEWVQWQENAYNQAMNEYNNWRDIYYNSASYKRSDAEAAGYNPNYYGAQSSSPSFQGPSSFQASPMSSLAKDPISAIDRVLSLVGQGTGIASQGIGTYMNVLAGLDAHKKNSTDIANKHLSNNVQTLTLYKIAAELFGGENAHDIVGILQGNSPLYTADGGIERPGEKYKSIGDFFNTLLKNGPLMTQLGSKADILDQTLSNLITKGESLGYARDVDKVTSEQFKMDDAWSKILQLVGLIAKFI